MQADDAESPRGATALAATAAAALVGPYPIDEDALRKLKRLRDDGVIDEHTFKRAKAFFLGLRETIDLADARSMVDAIVDALGEGDAAIRAREGPPPTLQLIPGELRQEVFSLLDERTLGRLELCVRGGLGSREATELAWSQFGKPRGAFEGCTAKQFAVAELCLQQALPKSMEDFERGCALCSTMRLSTYFGEFAFTWGFCWNDGDSFHSATFKHMTCHSSRDHEQSKLVLPDGYGDVYGEVNNEYIFEFPADAPGHATLAPLLTLLLSDEESWSPPDSLVVFLLCTRKRDGATVEFARFKGVKGLSAGGPPHRPRLEVNRQLYGELSLGYTATTYSDLVREAYPGELGDTTGDPETKLYWVEFPHLVLDKATGKLRHIFFNCFLRDIDCETSNDVRLLMHTLCDQTYEFTGALRRPSIPGLF